MEKLKEFSDIRRFSILVVLLGLIFPLQPLGADAQRPIKVGILDTYTGPPAVYGQDALNGFKLALSEINKKGVLGTKIEFTNRDDKFKVDIALSMAKELVMNEKVDILVGTINSGVALAVSDFAKGREGPLYRLDLEDRKNYRGEGPSLRLFHRRKHLHGRQGRRSCPFQKAV